jgi:hypothetical protein
MGENLMETLQLATDMASIMIELLEKIGTIVLAISGGCAWLSSQWPRPKHPGFWRELHWLVNMAGGNVRYATNAATDRRRQEKARTADELIAMGRNADQVLNEMAGRRHDDP